ncbi:AUX/IAA transcriptional regulator family protein [Perilla frutescens var. hirtella]|uniref:Auxin-responsive protein n=1 Tax=Perilla frutescens var. hirtella TaxID=608512 RepID=A0AAD4IUF6_PERFH|nr:AUX/IAA transcriptional regulator family protein [Perilla frutescens var. hirtella]KAH6816366.1 AUX/IAA transcriptional regulator family protein [Perilla frutescens var. frutescens]KAH6821557.1 AUX/IAA transcriptional regulator family protein [Perilla frutescens var. hirtella]
MAPENDDHLNLKATELRLGLPGSDIECDDDVVSAAKNNKRASPETMAEDSASNGVPAAKSAHETAPAPKAQIVGWPPVKSYRKNNAQAAKKAEMYVKVSVDGAPYLRKIDLKLYNGYSDLLNALETMFKLSIEREGYKGSEYAPAYEDKDGDLMLVGDVPWEMFMSSCKRLRMMRGADARGLGFAQ